MLVETENHDGIYVVRLSSPPVNALNLELGQAANQAIKSAEIDENCKALVLTGLEGVFSSGIDTRTVPFYDEKKRSEMLRTINNTLCVLYSFPKPTVAAVSGHALGGAFVLALACDQRFLVQGEFKLGLTEGAAGIPFPACAREIVKAEFSPESIRKLVFTSAIVQPDSPELVPHFDEILEPRLLLITAIERAVALLSQPAFSKIKAQFRGDTISRLRQIVEFDEEPLHADWV